MKGVRDLGNNTSSSPGRPHFLNFPEPSKTAEPAGGQHLTYSLMGGASCSNTTDDEQQNNTVIRAYLDLNTAKATG